VVPSRNGGADSPRILLVFFAAALVLLGLPATALDAEPIVLSDAREERPLERDSEILFDADPSLSIEQVSRPGASPAFARVGSGPVYVDTGAPVAWLRFRLETAPGAAAETQWLLEVRPSFSIILDRLDLFLPDGTGGYRAASAGALLPKRPGEFASPFFVFELPRSALGGEYCYLRMESAMAVEVHASAWPALAIWRKDALYCIAYSLIYGVLIGMLLYNLFLSISLKDRAYLYYVLYIGSSLLWQFWVQGHAKALLGVHPGVDLALMWVFIGGTLVWGAAFSLAFLSVRPDKPVLFWSLAAPAALGLATAGAGLAGLRGMAFGLSHVSGTALPIMTIVVAAARLRQGYKPAKYYLVGWSFLAVGGLAFALMGFRILKVSFWTVNGVAVGMALESVLLSLALGERVRALVLEKERLQRTQARYIELSVTDALTGLYNKRYFSSKIESEAEHARRIERPLSLVYLDLDDFKAINDEQGHPFGDAVLADLAAAIRESIRERDVACRVGGEEFAVIMPGTALDEAYLVAERLRARIGGSPLPVRDRCQVRVPVTASLGVAQLAADEAASVLVDRADEAMYEAKRLGKNRSVRARPISSAPPP
jgi:diguanylate cyclase (GGDEF)-like protein